MRRTVKGVYTVQDIYMEEGKELVQRINKKMDDWCRIKKAEQKDILAILLSENDFRKWCYYMKTKKGNMIWADRYVERDDSIFVSCHRFRDIKMVPTSYFVRKEKNIDMKSISK